VNSEVWLAMGYAVALLLGAGVLEWLSAHTHRRSLRYRTSGFSYDAQQDSWECPEGQHLWPHAFDPQGRVVRYRAKAHICNGCPRKSACTDSDSGREVTRPLDPWPHSEAGRFHRGISLMLVALSVMVLVVAGVRNNAPAEAAMLGAVLAAALVTGRLLLRDFRRHPAGFPEPAPSHGLGVATSGTTGNPERSRWASQNRVGGPQ
jgi:hypothetical protein